MLTLYIVSAVVAGVLVILSLVGADHDHDHDFGHDHDTETHGHWLPFFSLRFYTYFFGALGVTGLLLTFLTKTDPIITAWISGVVGLLSGLSVAILIRLLKVTEANGSASDKDVLGKEAEVLVPIRGTNPGRIRCMVKGDIIDFLAISEEERDINVGEHVVVVAMENGRAQVVSRDAILPALEPETVI